MTLHFHYDKQAVIDALRFHFMNRPEMKFFKVVLILMILSAFAGYFFGMLVLSALIWIFLLFVVLVLFFWYILPYSVYRKARTFREKDIRLDWDTRSLTIVTDSGQRTLPWDRFSNVLETSKFFYLYQSNKSFFLIPAAAFADREDRVAFSELLQNRFSHYTFN